jgi:hypothetical protein
MALDHFHGSEHLPNKAAVTARPKERTSRYHDTWSKELLGAAFDSGMGMSHRGIVYMSNSDSLKVQTVISSSGALSRKRQLPQNDAAGQNARGCKPWHVSRASRYRVVVAA